MRHPPGPASGHPARSDGGGADYATLDTVRQDLRLLTYVRDSTLLSYSDAFPFNALRAFPWSRVTGPLRREGLVDDATARCLFRDPAVSRLVEFVADLENLAQLRFKHRLPVGDAGAGDDDRGARVPARVAAGVRAWVGLSLLPRYVGAACDILDATRPDHRREALLDQLRADFDVDLGPVRALRAGG